MNTVDEIHGLRMQIHRLSANNQRYYEIPQEYKRRLNAEEIIRQQLERRVAQLKLQIRKAVGILEDDN